MYQVSKSKRRFFPSNLWNINMREELDYEQFFCLFTSLKIPFPNSKQKYKYYMFIVWIKGAVCDVAEMRRSFVFLSIVSALYSLPKDRKDIQSWLQLKKIKYVFFVAFWNHYNPHFIYEDCIIRYSSLYFTASSQ